MIFLSLAEPPCILEKPESMNVLPGSKVYFNVLHAGTPPLTIKWFKNQKEILSSADCLVIKDNTSTSLALFFAKSSDSADYVCEIQNDVGSTSCQATLFVKGWLPHHLRLNVFKFPANPSALHHLGIIIPEHSGPKLPKNRIQPSNLFTENKCSSLKGKILQFFKTIHSERENESDSCNFASQNLQRSLGPRPACQWSVPVRTKCLSVR